MHLIYYDGKKLFSFDDAHFVLVYMPIFWGILVFEKKNKCTHDMFSAKIIKHRLIKKNGIVNIITGSNYQWLKVTANL